MARTLTRVALGLAASFALAAFIRDDRFSLLIRASVLGLALFAWRRPSAALLVVAAIAPFIDIILVTLGSPPVRSVELIVVAFLAGWLFSAPSRRVEATRAFAVPAALLAALVLASIAQVALELYRADQSAFWSAFEAVRDAYLATANPFGLIRGAELVEGLALIFAVVELAAARPSLRRELLWALAAGGMSAALLAVLLPFGIGLPISLARQKAPGFRRFAAHIGDVNAAGAYHILVLGIACALAATAGKRGRIAASLTAAASAMALVLSGSRSAFAAALAASVAAAGWWAFGRERRSIVRVALGVCLATAATVGFAVMTRMPMLAFLAEGFDMRRDFAAASFRMIAARPVFGVGVGRYFELSRLVLSPALAKAYGYENAHNYWLQLTAEIGVLGLLASLWVLSAAVTPLVVAVRSCRQDVASLALLAGLIGFLMTWFSGHPTLVQEAAIPFWLALGVAASTPYVHVAPARTSTRSLLPMLCGVLLLGSVPFRPGVPRLRLPPGADGFGQWQEAAGARFRAVSKSASLFLPPAVTFIEIPMRLADSHAKGPVTVLVRQPRWSEHNVAVRGGWVSVPVTLPPPDPLAPYQRIDLHVADDANLNPDGRGGGIDVGEIRILAARE